MLNSTFIKHYYIVISNIHIGQLSASKRPIKSCQFEEYLQTIGQTFLTMGESDPCLGLTMKIDHCIQCMLRTYSKQDLPPNRVKPVPIEVLHHIVAVANASGLSYNLAIADMITVAFFFYCDQVKTLHLILTPHSALKMFNFSSVTNVVTHRLCHLPH